jgi:hypothetical protein
MLEWLKSLFGGKKNEEATETQNTEPETMETMETEKTEAESSNEEQAQ